MIHGISNPRKEILRSEKIIDNMDFSKSFRYPAKEQIKLQYPGPFKFDLPEIYQIEVTNQCNYNCIMCPRDKYTRQDKTAFIDPILVKDMIYRGDFANSYFVELQLSGEPLLHPKLGHIIRALKKTGVLVGLSTNGYLFKKEECIEACEELDYITFSIDSVTNLPNIRKGAPEFRDFWYEHIRNAVTEFCARGITVDFQFIELGNELEEMISLVEFAKEDPYLERLLEEHKINIRTIPNCSLPVPDDYVHYDKSICLNPWFSVTVQCNGNVTPCCFAWGDSIVYGNLKEQSLKEIWEGEKVEELRQDHLNKRLRPLCNRCYQRSPALLHMEIFFKSIRGRKK